MNSALLNQIIDAVLYEGYILYPYRASSKKNQRERFTFGRVYPKDYTDSQKGAEPCLNQTECLLRVVGDIPELAVSVRFLHPMWREAGIISKGEDKSTVSGGTPFRVVSELSVGGTRFQSWQEATEREVNVSLPLRPAESSMSKARAQFFFPASRVIEPLGVEGGVNMAIRRRQETLAGLVELEAVPVQPQTFKIAIRVMNRTPLSASQCSDSDAVVMRTFASTHTVLSLSGGEFISLMDPPAELEQLAGGCKNIGTWPILVGDENRAECDTMLSSPVILYDYPKIAPESVGSFFDGTEIDEMLTLRVLTMTDSEKLEMRQVDEHARRLLERTEATNAETLLKMHGIMRGVKPLGDFFNPTKPLTKIMHDGRELRVGGAVKIHPKKRADAMDMVLDGKTAFIEAIEEDAEGAIHLALVVEDDPGKDLGLKRQPGHRFFYSPDEVEPFEKEAA